MLQRVERPLDAHEIRVIGCLFEKEQATPEYYPLTLNALVAACNQRSNRDPVLTLSDRDVAQALQRLAADNLARRDDSGRATRWRQRADREWRLDPAGKAVLTVLLLRGAQTAGEVRNRTSRLHDFASSSAAESALAELAGPPSPIVELLEREPGQKEPRWMHRVGGAASEPSGTGSAASAPAAAPPPRAFDPDLVVKRLELLEQQVQELQAAIKKPELFD